MLLQIALASTLALVAPQAPSDVSWVASPNSLFALNVRDVPGLRTSIASNLWFDTLTSPTGPVARAIAEDPTVRKQLAQMRQLVNPETDPSKVEGLDPDVARALALLSGVRGGAILWMEFPDGVEGAPLLGAAAHTGANTAAVAAGAADWIREAQTPTPTAFSVDGVSVLMWADEALSSDAFALLTAGEHIALLTGPVSLVQPQSSGLAKRMALGAGSHGLLRHPRHGAAMASLRAPGQVDLFADLQPWMAMAGEAAADSGETASNLFEASGLAAMGWVAGRMGVGAGERLDFELVLEVPPGTLVAQMLDLMRPLPMALLERVPATATAVSATSYDLAGLLRMGLEVAERIEPGSGEIAEGFIDMASGEVGVDLREDLLDLLTGEVVSYTTQPPTTARGMANAETLNFLEGSTMLIGLTEADLFADSIELVMESALGTPLGAATAESRARTADLGMGPDSPVGHVAFGPGMMAVSLDAAEVHTATRTETDRATSVLGTRLLGAHLLELTGTSFASVASTSATIAGMGSMLFIAGPDVPFTEADVEELASRFTGTTVRTVERLPGALRFHQGTR